ncbi:MAG: serine hydrolase domain-containing protein [Acidobacteriaceae bacterium]
MSRVSTVGAVCLIVAVSSLWNSSVCSAQKAQKTEIPNMQDLSRVAIQELKETQTPGAVIAIVSGDKVIFTKAYGIADIETGEPTSPDMLFQIGSTTKMFVAASLLNLSRNGRLTLDAPIGSYLKDLGPQLSQVTAHQLLTHTAGLIDKLDDVGSPDESSLASGVRSFVTDGAFFTQPGQVFSYSSLDYDVAGLLMQRIAGKPFADVMQDEVFDPLGMSKTTFRLTTAVTFPLAVGNVAPNKVWRPIEDRTAEWGSGGLLYSNVHDLAQFAIAFMNGGKLDGRQVLDPSVIREMSTGYTTILTRFTNGQYGYGLMLHDYRGLHVVEHHGSVPGFGCTFEMVPEYHFAFIALYNRQDAAGGRLKKTEEKAFSMFMPLTPPTVEATQTPMAISQAEMLSYVGKYRYGHESTIQIVVHNGKLETDDGVPIIKVGDHQFLFMNPHDPPTQFWIGRGVDGRHQYLHISLHAWEKTS